MAITNCLNFGNPEKPEVFYTFREAVEGMAESCRALETPVTGGNVSFYNENQHGAVYPTPTVGMMGLLTDISHATTLSFKNEGDSIYLVGINKDELGASEYLSHVHHLNTGKTPVLDLDLEKSVQAIVLKGIRNGLVNAAHDCAEGGLAVALTEMAITGNLGSKVNLEESLRSDVLLFGESQSRIIVTIPQEKQSLWEEWIKNSSTPIQYLGNVEGKTIEISQQNQSKINVSCEELYSLWKEALPCILSKH